MNVKVQIEITASDVEELNGIEKVMLLLQELKASKSILENTETKGKPVKPIEILKMPISGTLSKDPAKQWNKNYPISDQLRKVKIEQPIDTRIRGKIIRVKVEPDAKGDELLTNLVQSE